MKQKPFAYSRIAAIAAALCSPYSFAQNPAEHTSLDAVYVRAAPVRALVNEANIVKSTGADMRDVMADRIDVGVGGGSAAGQWVSVRGIGQNRIDMVVDNATTTNQLWVHQSRFQLDPAMIKNLTVEKGAGAASAGIGASNGAVRATTVDAADLLRDDKPVGARIGFNWRSNKGINGNAAVYGNHAGFDALVLGSWQNDKDYKDGAGRTVTNTALKQDNYLAKLSYQFNEHHRLSGSYRQERFQGDMSIRPEFICFTGCIPGEQQPIETTQKTLNLAYTGTELGKLGNIEANVFRVRSEDERKPFTTTGWAEGNKQQGLGKTTGANLGFTTPLGESGHLLKYGYNFRKEQVSSLYVNEKKREHGLYAEGIWDFAPLTLTTGLRYDHFRLDLPNSSRRESGGYFNPSVGLIWQAAPGLNVNAKWAQVSRSPQLDYPVRATGRGVSATMLRRSVLPGIKAERTQSSELGLNWQRNGFNFSGSVFHQHIKDYIDLLPTGTRPWTNVGRVQTYGYELNGVYRYEGLTARIGTMYTKIKPKNFLLTADGRSLLPQGQQWLAGLSYRFKKPDVEIGWRGRFARSIEFDGVNSRAIQQHFRRAGYGVHDVFANWQPYGDDRFNLNLAVNNISNKIYRSHSQTADDTGSTRTFAEPGREVRLSVNYRF